MHQISTSEKIKLNLAKLKKQGETFEINIDPDLAMDFKQGKEVTIREILKAEQIFSDAKKGELASEAKLEEVFKTTDPVQIAEIIIKEGEVQLTSEFRSQQREQKKKQIMDIIHKNAIDPNTKLPHPLTRIDNAFQEAKVQIADFKSAEEQLDEIVVKLRPILPLKFEQANLKVQIPAVYAAKSYSVVKKYSKMVKEEWNQDGSWTVDVELPAGLKPEFMDKLNSLTHGEAFIKEKQI